MNLVKELKGIIKGEVKGDAKTLEAYSLDASLFKITPQVVVFPKDKQDIQTVVRFVARYKKEYPGLGITVRSGGTDMTGGAIGESIILDVSRHLTGIKKVVVTKNGGYAVVEPGVFYRDFEKATLAKGLIMPAFPASREICTVGGMVANNAGGENTLMYGKVEDYVEELKIILKDGNEYVVRPLGRVELGRKMKEKTLEGELYRKLYALINKNRKLLEGAKPNVSKNSAGYYLWNVLDRESFNLCRLLVGSQGTLGIITEIKLRLIRPERYSKMLVVFLRDIVLLGRIVPGILKEKPDTLESYDDHTLGIALKFLPNLVGRLKGSFVSLAFSFLPEAWMVVKGGFRLPKLVILAEFGGSTPGEAEAEARRAKENLKPLNLDTRLVKSERETEKYRIIRRESFNLLRHKIKGKQTAPFVDDIIVRPEFLPKFWPRLHKILDDRRYDLLYTIAGHVGDGNFHIIPLMDLSSEKDRRTIPEVTDAVYKLVLEFGGSITAEHNDGLIRAPYLRQMFGQKVYKLFEETKKIFDPDGIFNPGKKLGTTKGYVLAHMKRGK